MLLFLGLPLLFMGVRDFAARAASGRLDAFAPAIGAVFGAVFVIFGLFIVARVVSQIMTERRGRIVDATVVEVTVEDDGSCTVHYSYQDGMGDFRQGRFWSEREGWRFGDKGKARVDRLAPEKSVWIVAEAPRPPPLATTPPSRGGGRAVLRLMGLAAAFSVAAGGIGVYFLWEKTWAQHGFIAGVAEIGAVTVLGLFFALTMVALIPAVIAGALVGLVAMVFYTFVRYLMRD
jgi:hypothetical protein